MTAKRLSFILIAVLIVYLLIAGSHGIRLIGTGEPVAVGFGVAILILPLIGFWVVWREIKFGSAVEREWQNNLKQRANCPLMICRGPRVGESIKTRQTRSLRRFSRLRRPTQMTGVRGSAVASLRRGGRSQTRAWGHVSRR